jgi:hypothetical protein
MDLPVADLCVSDFANLRRNFDVSLTIRRLVASRLSENDLVDIVEGSSNRLLMKTQVFFREKLQKYFSRAEDPFNAVQDVVDVPSPSKEVIEGNRLNLRHKMIPVM